MMNDMTTYTSLLPHQEKCYNKLKGLRVGALYMEMGTGKTRTALEFIKTRVNKRKIERVIWLCPCSVKANLLADIKKHSNLAELGILHICGIETLSTSIKENETMLKIAQNYKTMLIVDESSLIKNHVALRSVHITSIASKCLYRMILNGTPISKNEADLYSQWNLLDWRILGYQSYWSFAANHLEIDRKGRIRRALNVNYLAEKIAPYTFQCRKEECFTLPVKKVFTEYFAMTDKQDENYEYVIDNLLMDLDEMKPESIYQLFGALQAVTSGFGICIEPNLQTSRYKLFEDPADNPRIKKLLELLAENDEKTIIFCTYTDEILTICKILNSSKAQQAVSFYGKIDQKNRQKSIEVFHDAAQFFVTNKACGAFGLNLQFCHRIIYYSHDWDWGTRAQSEDRVHRFGQTQPVIIQEICALNSIDEQILRCLGRKGDLVSSFKREIRNLTKKNINNFVRGRRIENLSE